MKKSYSHVEALIFRWNVVYCNVGSDIFLVEIHFSSSAARTSYRVCNRLLCCFIEFSSVCWFNTLCDVVEPIIEFCKWVCRNLCCFGCFFVTTPVSSVCLAFAISSNYHSRRVLYLLSKTSKASIVTTLLLMPNVFLVDDVFALSSFIVGWWFVDECGWVDTNVGSCKNTGWNSYSGFVFIILSVVLTYSSQCK